MYNEKNNINVRSAIILTIYPGKVSFVVWLALPGTTAAGPTLFMMNIHTPHSIGCYARSRLCSVKMCNFRCVCTHSSTRKKRCFSKNALPSSSSPPHTHTRALGRTRPKTAMRVCACS